MNWIGTVRKKVAEAEVSDRSFGFVLAIVLFVVAFAPLFRGLSVRPLPCAAGILCLAIAFVAPSILRTLKLIWLGFGLVIGSVVSPIVLAVVFYGVFAPLGVAAKLTGRDALRLRMEPQATSYWQTRPDPSTDMYLQF